MVFLYIPVLKAIASMDAFRFSIMLRITDHGPNESKSSGISILTVTVSGRFCSMKAGFGKPFIVRRAFTCGTLDPVRFQNLMGLSILSAPD